MKTTMKLSVRQAMHNHNPNGRVSKRELQAEYIRTREHVKRAASAVKAAIALHPHSIHLDEFKRAETEMDHQLSVLNTPVDLTSITMEELRLRSRRASSCSDRLSELMPLNLVPTLFSVGLPDNTPAEACGTTGKTPENFVETLAAFLKFRNHVYDAVREIKATRGLYSLDTPHYVNGQAVYLSDTVPETYEQLTVATAILAEIKKGLVLTGHFDGEPALPALQVCKLMANAGFDYGIEESDVEHARKQLNTKDRDASKRKS